MTLIGRATGIVLVLALLASCDGGADVPSTEKHRTSSAEASAVPSGPPPGSPSASAPCAVETRPRRLLTTGDTWALAELDAMSQVAFQLQAACDAGPPWPRKCDLFGDLLSEGWPGYRTEGTYYIAGVSLLNTSGQSIEEQLLLFRTPSSIGLKVLTDQAKACRAVKGTSEAGTVVYEFPSQNARKRFLVIERTAAILLTMPGSIDERKLITKARERAMTAG